MPVTFNYSASHVLLRRLPVHNGPQQLCSWTRQPVTRKYHTQLHFSARRLVWDLANARRATIF